MAKFDSSRVEFMLNCWWKNFFRRKYDQQKKIKKTDHSKKILVGFEWNEVISEMRKKSENAQN